MGPDAGDLPRGGREERAVAARAGGRDPGLRRPRGLKPTCRRGRLYLWSGRPATDDPFANLLADGFSMAVSNYLSTKSQQQRVAQTRRWEERHIQEIPAGEREEIAQIFARKGFEGDVLNRIVQTITADRGLWLDTMLTEEHGLQLDGPSPVRAGLATFLSFLLVGLIPLVPFLVPGLSPDQRFLASSIATGLAFLTVGLAKGAVLEHGIVRSGLETLLTGGIAALLAYLMGSWLRQAFGA
ncbi:MAG: VIT1/CCC1 transporter family protein [Gemmatimonadota bacterium]